MDNDMLAALNQYTKEGAVDRTTYLGVRKSQSSALCDHAVNLEDHAETVSYRSGPVVIAFHVEAEHDWFLEMILIRLGLRGCSSRLARSCRTL